MDFEYEYDEREKDGMVIEIDGLKINIPENLIQEKMELTGNSKEEVVQRYEQKMNMYKQCLLKNDEYSPSTFEKKFLEYLDDELNIFRPNNTFKFDPMAGFYHDNNVMK